jgi:hypothetical protein
MRRSPRAVLWAYVVVSVGCTPAAVRTPEPVRYVSADIISVPVASASRRMADTSNRGEPDTLSVKVAGPTAVHEASTVRFTATVTNGTAQRYYYWWFAAACARSAGCNPSFYLPVGEGEGKNEISVSFIAEHRERDLVVQVAELDGRGRMGSSPEFIVAGPATRRSAVVEGPAPDRR